MLHNNEEMTHARVSDRHVISSPTHSTVVYNLHVHVHADIPNVDTTEWSEDPQLRN